MSAFVSAVSLSSSHTFSKGQQISIKLLEGLGVQNDAHAGITVKHRSRVAQNPDQPNLRQVHLIHSELHEELSNSGFKVSAGEMGENITTKGIDLLALPARTRLKIGNEAILEITGLRNPCLQLEQLQPGLMKAVLDRDENGKLIRKAGVMAVVIKGGSVKKGDVILVELPSFPHFPLEMV